MTFDPIRISKAIQAEMERRLAKAAITLANELKEVLSVPAPRVKLNAADGAFYYRAGWLVPKAEKLGIDTSRQHSGQQLRKGKLVGVMYVPSFASPGAPPRKLSGRLRSSVAWEIDKARLTARVGTNVIYGRRLELSNHEWLLKTVKRLTPELEKILGAGTVGQELQGVR